MATQFEKLTVLHNTIRTCEKCPLSQTRTQAVPGEGPGLATVMFVGEGPGREEDAHGRPFVGRAGRVLDELIVSIGLRRNEVFISNIIKCRAHVDGKDRRPGDDEIAACSSFLDKQIDLVKPKVICALGDTAANSLLNKFGLKTDRIGKIHGRVYQMGAMKLIPTYHPAAALYAFKTRTLLEKDFNVLRSLL